MALRPHAETGTTQAPKHGQSSLRVLERIANRSTDARTLQAVIAQQEKISNNLKLIEESQVDR